jgi:hypothetical protein
VRLGAVRGQYRDGEAVAGDDADDATHRRVLFRDWDRDGSGRLDRAELLAMLSDGPASLSAGEVDMVLYQVPAPRRARAARRGSRCGGRAGRAGRVPCAA